LTNIFVTGASGLIGSHLVSKLKERNKVICLVRDFLPSPWVKWISEALTPSVYVRGDISDDKLIRRILAEYEIDHVYHLASQAIVKTALKDPLGTFQTNIMGTVNLLEACRQIQPEKILVMSTDKIYGDRLNAEADDPAVAGGPYETSKSCQDLIAQSYMETCDMPIVIPRSCNAYGYDLSPRIIPNTIRSCLKGEPPIAYEGEETKRQYVYVEDLVSALIHLMSHAPYRGIYNIATNDFLSQKLVVIEICKFFPLTPRFTKRDKPIKEIKSNSMVCSNFGWKPKYSFSQGIQKTIEAFKKYGF